jgi:hypothetical protein
MLDLEKLSNQILQTKSEKKLISIFEKLINMKLKTQDSNDINKIDDIIKEIDKKILQMQQKELTKILSSIKIKI